MLNKIIEKDELNILKDDLLYELLKDAEIKLSTNLTEAEKDKFLRTLIIMRTNEAIDEKLMVLQDEVLSNLNRKNLQPISGLKFKNNVEFVTDNVFNYDVDMAVVVSENLLENMLAFINKNNQTDNANENKNFDIDNELLFMAGMQLKIDLIKLLKSNNNKLSYVNPYIVDGYNLKAGKIAKLLIDKNFNDNAFTDLKQNIENLFKYLKLNNIKSVAFNLGLDYKFKQQIVEYIIKLNKKCKLKIIFNN